MSKKSKKFGLSGLIKDLIPLSVTAVVQAEKQGGSGSDKLDYAAEWLAGLVDIPILGEAVEKALVKVLLTAVVELLNHFYGQKEWYQKVVATFDLDLSPSE